MDGNPLVNLVGGLVGGALRTVEGLLDAQPGGGGGGRFVVDHENVLLAAKVIQDQVNELQADFAAAYDKLTIAAPGTDDVSTRMARSWNDILVQKGDSYANRVRQYIEGLNKLVEQLQATARDYGYNEEQITQALGGPRVA
ncbi:PE domain-containing protein [Actinokineospora bangkokensis]|uniref:PE domain-containing protein n=1 Tax=Actinokineospora bangkokensis TaxID=1193682 RepID=A0A1Q9LFU6_9PSEU|nr:PE domain-containing protein [Actinokineospora bangkokensis]OLR90906.1 hypothetical protein BJP25_30585 [Actinokineospora bangkokensis]